MHIDESEKWVCHSYTNGYGARIRITYSSNVRNLPQFSTENGTTFTQGSLHGLTFYLRYTETTRDPLTIDLPWWVWEKYGPGSEA